MQAKSIETIVLSTPLVQDESLALSDFVPIWGGKVVNLQGFKVHLELSKISWAFRVDARHLC